MVRSIVVASPALSAMETIAANEDVPIVANGRIITETEGVVAAFLSVLRAISASDYSDACSRFSF